MYAVINAGGKQERVEVGELVDVELLDARPGDELSLRPLLVVDGSDVTVRPEALAAKTVTATVVGEVKGPKITGFTYQPKARRRRRYGHRQRYTTLAITGIGESQPPPTKKAAAQRKAPTPKSRTTAKSGDAASGAPDES